VGKCDTYLTYITSDFREDESLEQEVEAFLDIYRRKGNAAITSDTSHISPPFHFVIYSLSCSTRDEALQEIESLFGLSVIITARICKPHPDSLHIVSSSSQSQSIPASMTAKVPLIPSRPL
jgi:hypothetical protein